MMLQKKSFHRGIEIQSTHGDVGDEVWQPLNVYGQ